MFMIYEMISNITKSQWLKQSLYRVKQLILDM